MKLYLYGHDYKYAAEQMLLTMFPGQRPEYPEGKPEGEYMVLRLSRGGRFTTASCCLSLDGQEYRAMARAENSLMTDELMTDRICQRLIKNAAYRAALRSGRKKPAWGALTGVRPGKLLAGIINSGLDEDTLSKLEHVLCVGF